MREIFKRFILLFVVVVMITVLLPTIKAETVKTIKIGDYLQMGTYYGEPILWRCVAFEKISGYDIKGNPIIDSMDTVTEYQDGYLPLMISDRILCCKAFDASGINTIGSHGRGVYNNGIQGGFRQNFGSNYWGDSNIRDWLNSSASAGNVVWSCGNPPNDENIYYNLYASEAGFLNNFTEDEIRLMKMVTQKSLIDSYEYSGIDGVKNENYHKFAFEIENVVQNYATAYSENITDTIFLLDVKQINTIYNNRNILGEFYYMAKPTNACVLHSEIKRYSKYPYKIDDGTEDVISSDCYWGYWLRSPGCYYDQPFEDSDYCMRYVDIDGIVNHLSERYGEQNNVGAYGIRPAFYLDKSTLSFSNGNGSMENPYTIYPISVYLNNDQVTFDQPPIIQNGRIMIPIRAVTEKMGADVYYNEGIKTAFVKYGKKGVIIPAYSYDFPIAESGKKYSQWGKYTADVASTIENGRMLVPIRALCESMGCEVTWNENERTTYITYDDSPKEFMTNDEFGDINALYYASSTNYNPFSGYTDALMEYYASRNKGIDAAAYTYANYTTALSDLINTKASGRTNAELYAEVILAEILKDMPKTNTQKAKVASIFAKVLDSLSEKTDDALDVSEKLLEAYAIADTVNKLTYKTVDISELKTEEINETMNKFFTRTKITSKFDKADQIIDRIDNIHIMDHIDIGAFGVKELAYLITDYNSETALLESIRKYSDDEFFNNVVDNMIADYTNKWGKILKDMGNNGVKKLVDYNILELTEKFAEKNTSTAASFLGDFTTLYKLFTFTTDITSAVSGLSKKTDALMDLSGIILIMPELDKVYDKMRTGVLSGEVTAEEFISIFELERCTKKAAYKSIMDLSGNFGTGKSNKEIANEEIDNLNDMTYTLWK